MFNNSWEHDTSHLIHIPIERVKAYVLNDFKAVNTLELIKAGISLREIEDATISSVEIKPTLLSKRYLPFEAAKNRFSTLILFLLYLNFNNSVDCTLKS